MFINNTYALMRHAEEVNHGFSYGEELICSNVAHILGHKLSGKYTKIRIFHSDVTRTRVTAIIVQMRLKRWGFEIATPGVLNWLNEKSAGINNSNISSALPGDTDTFTVFVSHLPNISQYIADCYKARVLNCNIFSKDFVITRDSRE